MLNESELRELGPEQEPDQKLILEVAIFGRKTQKKRRMVGITQPP